MLRHQMFNPHQEWNPKHLSFHEKTQITTPSIFKDQKLYNHVVTKYNNWDFNLPCYLILDVLLVCTLSLKSSRSEFDSWFRVNFFFKNINPLGIIIFQKVYFGLWEKIVSLFGKSKCTLSMKRWVVYYN